MFRNKTFSWTAFAGRLTGEDGSHAVTGLAGSQRAYFISRLYYAEPRPMVVVVPKAGDAEQMLSDLDFFSRGVSLPLLYFPPYAVSPFRSLDYHNETAGHRIRVLYRMMEADGPPVVVTTVEAFIQKLIPKAVLNVFSELVMVEEALERDRLVEKLENGGYARAMLVEEPGDYSVRGGVLDIFSPQYEDPLRIEFFGDMVDSLRHFSPVTQRSLKDIPEAVILPAGEAVLQKAHLKEIVRRIRIQAAHFDLPAAQIRDIIEPIKHQGLLPRTAGLLPLLYDAMDSFLDYLPAGALFFLVEPSRLKEAGRASADTIAENHAWALANKKLCAPPDTLYVSWKKAWASITKTRSVSLSALPVSAKGAAEPHHIIVREHPRPTTPLAYTSGEHQAAPPIVLWIAENVRQGSRTLIVCRSPKQAQQLRSLLAPHGIAVKTSRGFPQTLWETGRQWDLQLVGICIGSLSSGFAWPGESMALITADDIFGFKTIRTRKAPSRRPAELLNLEDLKSGDLIVHDDHGIGRYEDLVKLKLDRSVNDYLLIIYRDDDKLYLPVDRMAVIRKYMGVEGINPVLDKMGGKSWERVKTRVKRSAEKIAGELLSIYAARKVKQGCAFKEAGIDFKHFEAGFAYEETPDQSKAIRDVIRDMQKSTPMDRLICGDVGYGKTEVALRASYLAVNNFKQVAVLVPTTVLAEQHYHTFTTRFRPFPVKIACLSRFRSPKVQREIIQDIRTGKIDIVIGTHRLLSKDVEFKDLRLFVLDEEQRFGVKHKERLKKLRHTVDVLALTATPIPRTLHLSLTGVRDISIISTPPEFRQAITTYISEPDDAVIVDAIRRELHRKGQIFFIHNNIQTIHATADHVNRLVPEVRLAVAHGRMGEVELEKVMLSFAKQAVDMLVCTTIIESGLDIPSANTMLINRADRFGLAQMYQLRGRVGRSENQAYAYLFIPKESGLTRKARKRLKVLMEHSDLGSGFQIAMSDLKIRGGGTILGSSQSGHIAAVGYDMFLKLMKSAIADLKGESTAERLEPEINISQSAFLPETYITDIDQRLFAYRRLTRLTSLAEIADFKSELVDRFGPLPGEANHMLLKIMLKILAGRAGVKKLDFSGNQLMLFFSTPHLENPAGILKLIEERPHKYALTPNHVLKVRLSPGARKGFLQQTKNILKEIIRHVKF